MRYDKTLPQLQVLQVNVARSPSPHEAALQLAFEQEYHVVLIQEPWISNFRDRRLSKHHPAFQLFTPIEDWSNRPRTLTYIRKHPQLKAEPVPHGSQPSRDLTAVQVNSGNQQVTLLNVYNAPRRTVDSGEGLKHLISQPLPVGPCLVAGDFNLHHPQWRTNATITSPGAEPFLQWADQQGLHLTLQPNTPTRGNSTIDLVWVNNPLICQGTHTEPAPGFPALADHIAISTSIHWHPVNNTKPEPPLRMATMQEDIFHSAIHKEAEALGEPPPAQLDLTPEALDQYTSAIIQAIKNALEASTKRAHAHPSGHRWWNEDCQEAVLALRRAAQDLDSPSTEIEAAQRTFRCTVRQAKRHYWRTQLDNFTDSQDVFKAIKWNRTEGSFPTPPLKDGNRVHTTANAKAELLVKTLLQKAAGTEDIPVNCSNPEATLPFPNITTGEAHQAIFRAKSSTPGQDEISNAVLKKAWPVLGLHISALYKHCATTGWHPTPFRQAILVALPKPGKKDYSSPRSYRLIALLSTLGKGLERLMARRLAWTAIRHKVLHPQQFGALPCRSATDLAAALVHDIEEAWARGLFASMLTLDIKGAFDAVLRGRLIQRLRSQGWPPTMLRWVSSFTQDRTAAIRLDGHQSPIFAVPAGLPQGSPVSPILFMLYIEPIFKLGPVLARRGRFGYADDICQLVVSQSLEENTIKLQNITADLMAWGHREGLTFDLAKTELQHYAKGRKGDNPACTIHTPEDTVEIKPPSPNGATRWLGIWFDRKLNFKAHARTLASKAKQAAGGIQALANTVRGVKAPLLRQATIACVVSVLCYGAEAWWPGMNRPAQDGSGRQKSISNRVSIQLACLDRVLRSALLKVLPVFKTTPTAALHREAAIPPMELLLNQRRRGLAIKAHKLDTQHPLHRRATHQRSFHINTRLLRAINPSKFHTIEQIDPLLTRPWDTNLMPKEQPTAIDKGHAREDFQRWLTSIPPRSMVVYTDGSKGKDSNAAGAGWVGYWGNCKTKIFHGHRKLPNHEVFDAEARAALIGIQTALTDPNAQHSTNLYICLDNLEAVQQLQGQPTGSSQSVFKQFQEAAQTWPFCLRTPNTQPDRVQVKWAPGHTGIEGNEEADKEAKLGCQAPPGRPLPPASIAAAKRAAQRVHWQCFAQFWVEKAPVRYRDLGIGLEKRPPELHLPRPALGRLLAARSGHGDFAEYHERFKHEDALLTCSCGHRKEPSHFYFCREGRKAAAHPWGQQPVADILTKKTGFTAYADWLGKSFFYTTICKRH